MHPPPGGVSSPGASGLPAGVGGSWWLSAEQPLLADLGRRAGLQGAEEMAGENQVEAGGREKTTEIQVFGRPVFKAARTLLGEKGHP